jgi:hypothetical protein
MRNRRPEFIAVPLLFMDREAGPAAWPEKTAIPAFERGKQAQFRLRER